MSGFSSQMAPHMTSWVCLFVQHGFYTLLNPCFMDIIIPPVQWGFSRVTLYTAGHLHTAVPHCSHSRAPIVHTAVPRENNEHGCVYLRCRAVCKLPGCVEGHPCFCWGILVSLRLSIRLSVHPACCPSLCPSRILCPLCNTYISGWILSILGTNDHWHERVCRMQWPLTLTYIFKIIQPWLCSKTAKIWHILPCLLYSMYRSGWILFLIGINDH